MELFWHQVLSNRVYVAWTVGIEIKAFVTCRHEVCVMVNASANTPNELVEHVWENVVLPIITERVWSPPFSIYSQLTKSSKNKKKTEQSSVMQYVLRVHMRKKRKAKKERRERESHNWTSVFFHVLFIYITMPPHSKRVHLHENSSRRSPWKGDAYKSTTPFHARKKIKVFIPGHKLCLKREGGERERENCCIWLNSRITNTYAFFTLTFFSKDCVRVFNNPHFDPIVHKVPPRARTDAIINTNSTRRLPALPYFKKEIDDSICIWIGFCKI